MKSALFLVLVLALIFPGCKSEPSISVSGTVMIPSDLEISEGANIRVHLSVIDSKKSMQYRLAAIKEKYPGTNPFEFTFKRVSIKELAKYDYIYVYSDIDLNADGEVTKDEATGVTSVAIEEPEDPIENVQVSIVQR